MHDHHHSSGSADHAHDHAHDHGHAHAHDHIHTPLAAGFTPARPVQPGFSLLRLSAGQRLGGAGLIVAVLWGAVFWALG